MALRALLREPLLHFVAVGGLLFGLDAAFASRPEAAGTVVVDPAWAAGVDAGLRRALGRPPTAEEHAQALAEAIDDELLYREAVAQGLGRGDPIIRRRLIQKARFLHEDRADLEALGDTDLAAYAATHAERYRLPPRLAITQVFAARDRHDDARAAAHDHLAALRAGADPTTLGDAFAHGSRLGLRSAADLDGLFGPGFTEALADLEPGAWGLAPSSYGWHAVRVDTRAPPADPPLAVIRGRVAGDLQASRRETRAAEALAELHRAATITLALDEAPALREALREALEERQ